MGTSISWTQETWNPTTGCDRVSPGCDHCYALTMAGRLKKMGQAKYQRDGDPRTSGPGFGLTLHPDALDLPLRWRKPRRVFVNSMADLFHPDVPDGWIAQVFAVMANAEQHQFQVLTKRPQRMAKLLDDTDAPHGFWSEVFIEGTHPEHYEGSYLDRHDWSVFWPLPNVWLGTSIESQQYAFRARHLLETPAAVRFLSAEPLLGPLDLTELLLMEHPEEPGFRPPIDWVIAGCESGPEARPMELDWVRSLRDQCQEAGVAFFFKQSMDGRGRKVETPELDGRTWTEYPA